MKYKAKLVISLAAPFLATAATTQAASVISSVLVSDGVTSTPFIATSTDSAYTDQSAVIKELTAGGTTYTSFMDADSCVQSVNNCDGVVERVLASSGTTVFPTASEALGHLDLSTGTLNPLGTGDHTSIENHDFASQTIKLDSVFFLV